MDFGIFTMVTNMGAGSSKGIDWVAIKDGACLTPMALDFA
jgi:hypothetical protein